MKGPGRQFYLFFGNSIEYCRTPGKFGRLTAEVEPEGVKQEGECFHVFMCVFSFTTGTYTYALRPYFTMTGVYSGV